MIANSAIVLKSCPFLSYKLPRHSTVCTNRQKGEMDISSASGPHSLDITFELAESRAREAAAGVSSIVSVCLHQLRPRLLCKLSQQL